MSLAMYAAPFDNDTSQVVNNDMTNHINKKKIVNNKTQKRYPAFNSKDNVNSEKVLSLLHSIHNLPEQSNELSDFNPIPPPISAGVQSTILRDNLASSVSPVLEPILNENVSQNTTYDVYSEDHNHNMSDDYYKRFIPNYNEMYKNTQNNNVNAMNNIPSYKFSNSTIGNSTSEISNKDLLIEKLNYMIHLLEEQQDERTSNVTEEIILYSFLGIFIIFIVDTFTRVGKYTR